MYQRILVPLDGSTRAEQALPVAARLARASGGSLVLLRAVAIPNRYGPYLFEAYLAQSPVFLQGVLDLETVQAKEYLADIAHRSMLKGIPIETAVVAGAAEPAITLNASVQQVDLIVMCRHTDTGFKRRIIGHLSQQLARHSPVPVLVLHEGGTAPTSSFPDRLRPLRAPMGLVALDGSALAEAALIPAAHLVAALAAPAHGLLLLTRVVNPAEHEEGKGQREVVDPRVKEAALDEARAYLNALAARVRSNLLAHLNLSILTAVAEGRDVANALITVAEQGKDAEGSPGIGRCDLMALATHGRSGVQRLVMGSVAEQVLGGTDLPVLVVPPAGPAVVR